MSDSSESALFEEFLQLLAEEQNLWKEPLTAKDVERSDYRRERIRELKLRFVSPD